MANAINAINITNNQATLSYSVDNTYAFDLYAYIFQGPAGLTFSQLEADPVAYGKRGQRMPAGQTTSGTVTVTGLAANTTYTYLMSVTDVNEFDPADVFFRRPLNPPGTFKTLGPPIFTDSSVSSSAQVNVSYSDGVSASSATSYSIASGSLPPGISLSSNTGAITGVPTSAGTYSFRVSANNSYGSTLTSTLSITVAPGPPVWTDQTINPTAVKDSPYSDGVSATNSASYRISSGSLPTGISLSSSTGSISGTPTVAGTSNFTVQAYNAAGTISVGLTLAVIEGIVPPVFTDDTLSTDLRRGIAYSDGVTASDATAYTTVGTFVPGLTLGTADGTVTGTPTAQGTYNFDIVASNTAGSATASFSLPVKPNVKKWDGDSWEWATTLKKWNGSNWVDVTSLKKWNGSNWEAADL